jgi:hypothetical protein
LKLSQFHYANFGLPPRIFVGEIGFLASWWVGLFCGWFVARVTVPAFPRDAAFHHSLNAFLVIFAFALMASVAGYFYGVLHSSDYSAWEDITSSLGVQDVPGFVHVAYIHNASYLGGLVGLVVALIHLRRIRHADEIQDIRTV